MRLIENGYSNTRKDVSIHAPTKGATCYTHRVRRSYEVSIHAPTKGATLSNSKANETNMFQSTHPQRVRQHLRYTIILINGFQSTHPQRVRQQGLVPPYIHLTVSIHAPTKGATRTWCRVYCYGPCFNPRTHKGCDTESI